MGCSELGNLTDARCHARAGRFNTPRSDAQGAHCNGIAQWGSTRCNRYHIAPTKWQSTCCFVEWRSTPRKNDCSHPRSRQQREQPRRDKLNKTQTLMSGSNTPNKSWRQTERNAQRNAQRQPRNERTRALLSVSVLQASTRMRPQELAQCS
jgi:hypothetical protein